MNLSKVFLRFGQLLALTVLALTGPSLQACEQQTTDLQQINTANLPQFVSQISADYYQQLESLLKYYELYQQKRDPRGFNVWHLRGFSPALAKQQAYYQQLQATASAESQPTVEKLITVFNELDTISTQLMVSFRENNPAAYQQAKTLITDNNAFLATQLKEYQLDDEIRDITLN
ncbi:MAG TPA: hypothetical protein VFM76_09225 [Methylophaga sp.]|nr:hypothetical protein [Methylophaga sp.]